MKEQKNEIRTATTIKQELDTAQADLTTTTARAAQLETAGDLEAVDELARLTARAQILRGGIKRLEAELPLVVRAEAVKEIERLQGVVRRETEAAAKAAAKLTTEAVKLLVPEPDAHPAWSAQFCQRRAHEIGIFAQEHPSARIHTDAARDAKAEIARLEKITIG